MRWEESCLLVSGSPIEAIQMRGQIDCLHFILKPTANASVDFPGDRCAVRLDATWKGDGVRRNSDLILSCPPAGPTTAYESLFSNSRHAENFVFDFRTSPDYASAVEILRRL
jgi:hypothetical protein